MIYVILTELRIEAMGTILTALERLLDKPDRRRDESPAAPPPPYPDASKAVEHFRLRLAQRVQDGRGQSPAWKRE